VLVVLVWGLLPVAACGGKTPIEPPPPPPKLDIICPELLTRDATSPAGTDVHFESPAPTGGQPPYSVECTPGSGSVFPVGESTVECKATDAAMQQATCAFGVRVRVAQTLRYTRFLAFGDSITEGKVSLQPVVWLELPDAYTHKLEQMLRERYPTQSFVVTPEGKGGERTDQGAIRLPGVLDAVRPEVMLLLEGVNAVRQLSTSRQVTALRSMISAAETRGVEVIIATVMPVSAEREADDPGTLAKITALNVGIRQLAGEFDFGLVDLYAVFEANPALIGRDGLHPTAEGHTRIAEAFRDEIVRRYESRATMTSR
jgi:lysophospholipase L1-like esterase